MKLSIGFTTARIQNQIEWLVQSLACQIRDSDEIEIIVIDANCESKWMRGIYAGGKLFQILVHPVKPNVWQGKYRLPKDNWWTVSAARNTFLCLAKHPFIAMLDDRCVLCADWLECIRQAESQKIIVAGSYEKRVNMTVSNGVIQHAGTVTGLDSREARSQGRVIPCPGEWLFGCNLAAPLEWFLKVNGYPEKCDSLSFEDCILGLVMQNNGFRMRYDPRAKIIEDRTPEFCGPVIKRTSKERFPHDVEDKAHTILRWARTAKKCDNGYDIRELREKIQRGENFPVPDISKPHNDWFDGQPIASFV